MMSSFQDGNKLVSRLCSVVPLYEERLVVKVCQIITLWKRRQMVKFYISGISTLLKLAHAINRDFLASKIENFQQKIFDIFLIFAENIDCGYTLEPPSRGGSNEYPQSMF